MNASPALPPLSGTQHTIRAAGYSATIASVGASLRELSFNGRPLILGFPADAVRPGYRGAILAPWPNRVIGGAYTVDGQTYTLPLNETDRGNAIHGLVQWLDWVPVGEDEVRGEGEAGRGESEVTLGATLQASDAYPFRLVFRIHYALSAGGLAVTLTAQNTGTAAAPYGVSAHPYFVAPGDPAAWRVAFDAAAVLDVDERLAPAGLQPVDAGDGQLDLRSGPEIRGRFIDNAYTDIARNPGAEIDGEGRDGTSATVRVTGEGGVGTEIAFGADFPWAQVYTGALGDPDGPSIAVEPMTCPPNAFATGTDLLFIAPGETLTRSWTIRSIG